MASNIPEGDESMEFENEDQSTSQPGVDPGQVRENVHLTLSLKWLIETKNRKAALEKSLQTWFSNRKSKVDCSCSVQEILPDGGAVIKVEPPPGVSEVEKLSGETLSNKKKTEFVTVLSVSLGKPKQDPQTAADASVNSTPQTASVSTQTAVSEPPADKVLVEEQKKPVSTAGDSPGEIQNMSETCVLSVIQYLYVSHIYKEELRVIENECGVEIKPEVTVKFEAKGKDGKPNEASSKFTDLVQKCFHDSNGSTFTLKSVQPDQLSSAMKFIMNKENKLLATMSSEETTVIGPSGSRGALGLMLNSSHKSSNTTEESGSKNYNSDVCLKISMTIKDDLTDAGLTLDHKQWKNLATSYGTQLAKISTKFNVDFQESSIVEEQVNIKASYKGSGGKSAMESHAVRALLRLYQKMMMSPLRLPSDYGATGFDGSKEASRRAGLDGHSTQNGKESPGNGATADSKDDQCSICLSSFTKKMQLKCKHEFCEECMQNAVKHGGPICPICKDVFGVMKGNQPGGKMTWSKNITPLPGFPHCGQICITYDIPSGKQTENHPNPGQYYVGTTRHAYLPDNEEGNEVLKLLKKAFDQKLIFTVGASRTTGAENMVTWNDIHHKTTIHGGPEGFGYPDETYLSRVKEELKAKGIE